MHELVRAMRFSNGIAIVLLFVCGLAFGRVTGYRPWLTGILMVVLGCALVGATIALGG
jgi:lipoprotein signal peptidase